MSETAAALFTLYESKMDLLLNHHHRQPTSPGLDKDKDYDVITCTLKNKEREEGERDIDVLRDHRDDGSVHCMDMESLASEAAEPGGDGGELPFSRELITFSLFGKMPAKFKRPWNEALSSRIAQVQESFKNIPQMLYFSPSSVSLDGIGVYAAESLPKDTLLGPYLGRTIKEDQVDKDKNNEWLWEVYDDATLSYCIDARDPKYGNWMNFIQCARHSLEQNLRMTQYNDSLYFVVTSDIEVRDELLVWYDEEQYNIYMGVPTGYREVPPHPLYAKQHTAIQDSARNAEISHDGPPSPGSVSSSLHEAPPLPSCVGGTRGSNFSDSASTDDSGIGMNMETTTSGLGHVGDGATTFTTYDDVISSHSPNKEMQTEEGVLRDADSAPGVMTGGVSFPPSSSANSAYHYVGLDSGQTEHVQWYNELPIALVQESNDIAKSASRKSPDHSSAAQTPTEGARLWGGAPQTSFGESLPGGSLDLLNLANSNSGEGKSGLLYGLFSRSEDGSRWHCEECKRLFSSQGSLRAHARIHTGERPYQCQYCFRAFCQASTLRSHERLHTGEKPYKCEDCGRAFTQSAGLRSHRKTHRYDS